jgi:hypothetical protein
MGWIKRSLLVCVFMLAGTTAYALQEAASFKIAFPQGTYPETASIFYAIVRDGADGSLSSGIVTTKKGVFEYPLNALSEYVTPRNVLKSLESEKAPDKSAIPPKNLKLLIYLPGYHMVQAEFDEAQLQQRQTFIPKLEPLRTIRLSGRLLDSSGKGRNNQLVSLNYQLLESGVFMGGADGFINDLPIARFMTGNDGAFTVEIPALADDPFFNIGQFVLAVSSGFPFGSDLTPNHFSSIDTRKELIITQSFPGILSGRIDNAFFTRNDLSSDAKQFFSLRLDGPEGRMGSSSVFHEDGTFELKVLPGIYDVKVYAAGKDFLVQRGFVIREGQREFLEIK